ncbi:MAG TPA: nucleotidyltransferase family protein [bacterium]|nr:nucleotidyltransferase family protein [bacterium]HOL47206.1 nucleotidyltransferase family protein [bacterium]HPQ18285.1 nucleotidyltransferase family protein [bacterium]
MFFNKKVCEWQNYFFEKILQKNFQSNQLENNPDFLLFLKKNFVFEIFYFFSNNENFREKFKKEYYSTILKNQFYLETIKNLFRNYSDKIVLLKGISLLTTIYKNHLSRHLSDIDIYVNNYDDIKKYLIEKNFKLIHSQVNYIETFRKENLIIDVHIDLINKNRNIWQSKLIKLNEKKFLNDNLVNIENNLFRLNNELELIYLISHLFIHHNFSILKWSADIILYLNTMNLNKKILINLLNKTDVNIFYIFFTSYYLNYINKKFIIDNSAKKNMMFSIIKNNRYLLHFYFTKSLKKKLGYIIFVIKYILRKENFNYYFKYIKWKIKKKI